MCGFVFDLFLYDLKQLLVNQCGIPLLPYVTWIFQQPFYLMFIPTSCALIEWDLLSILLVSDFLIGPSSMIVHKDTLNNGLLCRYDHEVSMLNLVAI